MKSTDLAFQNQYILATQEEIRKLIDISKQVHVHRSLLTTLSNQLRRFSNSLDQQGNNNSPVDDSERIKYEIIIKTIKHLQELYLSQYERSWFDYLLRHPVTQFLDEINQCISKLNRTALKLKLFTEAPIQWVDMQTSEENINDLGVIQNLFQGIMTSDNTEKLNEIISLKKTIMAGPNRRNNLSMKKSKYLSRKTIRASLSPFEEWEIDLNDIELQKKIGSGGFADVYLGYMKTDGTIIAVKQLHQQKFDEYMLEMYQREVRTYSELHHFAILPFVGAHMKPPYCIVTEYMNGGSLFSRLHTKDPSDRLSPTKLTIIALGIAYGMSYLHSQQIIHRDLKSLNILLDANDYPKICDFGLSRTKINDTMTGRIGTCQWMAPEVLSSQKYDEKADVYSYGIILWEMLTGDVPYRGLSDAQIAVQVCKNHSRPKIPRNCPQNMAKFIKICWSDMDKRPDFITIAKALEDGTILFPGTDVSVLKAYANQFSRIQNQPNMQINVQSLPPVDIDPLYVTSENVEEFIDILRDDEDIIPKIAVASTNPTVKEMLVKYPQLVPYLVEHLSDTDDNLIISYLMLLLSQILTDEPIMTQFLHNSGPEVLLDAILKMCSILIPKLLDCLILVVEAVPQIAFQEAHLQKLAPYLLCTDITQRQISVYFFTMLIDGHHHKSTRVFNIIIENLLKNTILEAKEELLTSALTLLLKIAAFHKSKEEFKFCFACDKICLLLKHSNPSILHLSFLLLQVLFARYEPQNSTVVSFLSNFSVALHHADRDGKLAGLNAFSSIMTYLITYQTISTNKELTIVSDLIELIDNGKTDSIIQIPSLRLCYSFCVNSVSVECFKCHIEHFVSLLDTKSNEMIEVTISSFASYCLAAILIYYDPTDIITDHIEKIKTFLISSLENFQSELSISALRLLGVLVGKISGAMLADKHKILSKFPPFLEFWIHKNDDPKYESILALALSVLASLSCSIPYCSLLSSSLNFILDRCKKSIEMDNVEQVEEIQTQKTVTAINDETAAEPAIIPILDDNSYRSGLLPFVCLSNMTIDPMNAKLCVQHLDTLIEFAKCDNYQKAERSLIAIHRIVSMNEGKIAFKSNLLKKLIEIIQSYSIGTIPLVNCAILNELVIDKEICQSLRKFGLIGYIIKELEVLSSKATNARIIYQSILSRLQSVSD